jgi:hypothetical protein
MVMSNRGSLAPAVRRNDAVAIIVPELGRLKKITGMTSKAKP